MYSAPMKKRFLFIFALLPIVAPAQNFHFSGRLGIAGYQGDLKAKTVSLSQLKPFFSIGARYDLTEHIMARSYISFTGLKGGDKKGNATTKQRNLNFQTKILDWELTGQYSFFSLNEKWWTPYVFAGVGLYHFKPFTKEENGNKVFLQPLSTEGQGCIEGVKPYKLWQFNLPFGIGAEYSLNEDMRLGLEIGYRKLFTDYLDDLSGQYVDETLLRNARGQQ